MPFSVCTELPRDYVLHLSFLFFTPIQTIPGLITKVYNFQIFHENIYFLQHKNVTKLVKSFVSPSLSMMVTMLVDGSGTMLGSSVEMLTLNLSITSTSGSSLIGMSAQDLLTVALNTNCTTVPL